MSVGQKTLGCAALAAALSLVVSGCGSEPEFAPQPGPPDGGADAAPPPPPPTTSTPPPPPPPPQAGPCESKETLAVSTAFQGRAATEAPGMKPDGQLVCAIVPEGQTQASQPFLLEPGFCYTFLGQALPTVTEVDITLELDLAAGGQMPPALAALNIKPQLAVDSDTGPMATIGAKQSCYQWALPAPVSARVVVKARSGSGPVAVQAYKKKK